MQHQIYDNGQLNVEITNVKASDEEIEKLKACIAKGIGSKNAAPVVHIDGMSVKGPHYTVKFSVSGPTDFNLSSVQEWLYSVGLVGYKIEAKSGPKE